MRVDQFDFSLPAELIALHPAEPRDSSRLLVVPPEGEFADHKVSDLEHLLQPGDVLVVNDTRVIPAELHGKRLRGETAASVSFNLHKRIDAARWAAFARPAKKLRVGDRINISQTLDRGCQAEMLEATIAETADGGEVVLKFDLAGAYIGAKRALEDRDQTDYQTVYAAHDGAVAAPTAGLHFTDDLMQRLADKGISIERVTLHVGAGTFLPVKVDDTKDHKMHAEWGEVSGEIVERIQAAKRAGGRVVAVGTTSLRLLESACQKTGELQAFSGDTDIFITPGYQFRAVDILITNFHLPRSTLFMLVSAFSGFENIHSAYQYAVENGYRFYSYGDASLLFRAEAST
jgi:S-adenosylmethionine:tRNA ribosyltransferase-isomerase